MFVVKVYCSCIMYNLVSEVTKGVSDNFPRRGCPYVAGSNSSQLSTNFPSYTQAICPTSISLYTSNR